MADDIFTYRGRYEQRQDALLIDLAGRPVNRNAAAEVRVATTEPVGEVKKNLLATMLNGSFNVTAFREQVLKEIRRDGNGARLDPPTLGDAEITIAGVPSGAGSASAVVTSIIRALAALGIAGAVYSFSQAPEQIGDQMSQTANAVSTSLVFPLAIVAFIVWTWKT